MLQTFHTVVATHGHTMAFGKLITRIYQMRYLLYFVSKKEPYKFSEDAKFISNLFTKVVCIYWQMSIKPYFEKDPPIGI